MSRDPREQPINDEARRVMNRENYDPHYATLENRLLMETRLFLCRFDALCKTVGVNPATFLHMLAAPAAAVVDSPTPSRWRLKGYREIVTEIARAELCMRHVQPLAQGAQIVVYRGNDGKIWCRPDSEFDNGEYERMSPVGGR